MEHLESLFNRALDAVVGMNNRGRVVAWNRAAEEIFGWNRDEALGQSMARLIVPPQHRAAHSRGLAHFNRTGEGPVLEQRIRISAIDRSAREFPVELSIFPMRTETGGLFYAFIRSLEAEEEHRRAEARRAQEADILLRVAENLLGDVSAESFTRECLAEICGVSGLAAGHALFVRGAGADSRLVPSGIWHLGDGRYKEIVQASRGMTFGYGVGLPGMAWKRGGLISMADIRLEPGFLRRADFERIGLTRGMALPVVEAGRTHVVLELYGTSDARLDEEILRLVRTIGSQIGLAMQRKEAAEQRDILRREIAHRVGNSMTVLSSIFRRCLRTASSVDELGTAFLGYINSVGQAHRLSIHDEAQSAPLRGLIESAVSIFPDQNAVSIEAPDLMVSSAAILPLSLVLGELVTNRLKHGSECGTASLAIRVALGPESLHFVWHEDAAGCTTSEVLSQREGFGSFLLRSMIEDRLGGSFERHLDSSGFRLDARFPAKAICA